MSTLPPKSSLSPAVRQEAEAILTRAARRLLVVKMTSSETPAEAS